MTALSCGRAAARVTVRTALLLSTRPMVRLAGRESGCSGELGQHSSWGDRSPVRPRAFYNSQYSIHTSLSCIAFHLVRFVDSSSSQTRSVQGGPAKNYALVNSGTYQNGVVDHPSF